MSQPLNVSLTMAHERRCRSAGGQVHSVLEDV
jgi:hypothetical protein